MEQPDALIMTGIGIGTSFSVLVLLLVTVLVIKQVSRLFDGDEQESAPREDAPAVDTEAKNRATAAAIAVTALLESRPYLRARSPRSSDE